MGHTISAPRLWNSLTGEMEDDGLTHHLVSMMVEFTSYLGSGAYPEEAKIVFEKPVVWKTEITPKDFKAGYKKRDNGAIDSVEYMLRGHRPLLSHEKIEGGYQLTVWTFEYLAKVLALLDHEGQLHETRHCLQQNRNLITRMLGERFSAAHDGDSAALELIDEVVTAAENTCRTTESLIVLKEKKRKLRLMLLLQHFDQLLMNEIVKASNKLDQEEGGEFWGLPKHVDDALKEIKSYCPQALIEIDYLEGYTEIDDQGYRAPEERKAAGDVAYILAQTHDAGFLFITASSEGYFINGGVTDDGVVNYENFSEGTYTDLTYMLEMLSKVFAEFMHEQRVKEILESVKAFHDQTGYRSTMVYEDDDEGEHHHEHHGQHGEHHGEHGKHHEEHHGEHHGEHGEHGEHHGEHGEHGEHHGEHGKHHGEHGEHHEEHHGEHHGEHGEHHEEHHGEHGEHHHEHGEHREEHQGEHGEHHGEHGHHHGKHGKHGKHGEHGEHREHGEHHGEHGDHGEHGEHGEHDEHGEHGEHGEHDGEHGGEEEHPEKTRGSGVKFEGDEGRESKLQVPGFTREQGSMRQSELFRRSMEEDAPRSTRFSVYTDFVKPLVKERRKPRRPSIYDWLEESSSSDEDEHEPKSITTTDNEEWSSSSWYVQKLVKILKAGNQSATTVALCSLADLNLQLDACNDLLRENGAMEVFVSLLDVTDIRCKIGSLKILQIIGDNAKSRQVLCELGCVQSLVRLLSDPNPSIKCHAAEAISHVVRSNSSRKIVRSDNGIQKLISLLDVPNSWSDFLKQNISELRPKLQARQTGKGGQSVVGGMRELWLKVSEKVRCGAMGLSACALSKRNRLMMRMNGIMPLIARQLHSDNEDILIPVVGIVKEFAKEEIYLSHIRVENMLDLLVRILINTHNPMLKRNAALALFSCAVDEMSRELVRKHNGLPPLVQCLKNTGHSDLLLAATGAIWKLSQSSKNLKEFQNLGSIGLLTELMSSVPEDVVVNIVGALSEMMKVGANREQFFADQGVQELLRLQVGSANTQLLVNVNNTLAQCALHDKSLELISKNDGVRLLWSAMRHPCPEVQASACWAVCPCITQLKDSGELVRCLVGGIGLLVSLLKSDHVQVLASACAAVAAVAQDEENLGILTDHQVVLLLSKLICTKNELLMRHLAESIAVCCYCSNNREEFGENNAVVPLVDYLKVENHDVQQAAAHALCELSKFPNNCIDMHKRGCIKYLTQLTASRDPVLQEYCAGCISNVRRMALANYLERVGR